MVYLQDFDVGHFDSEGRVTIHQCLPRKDNLDDEDAAGPREIKTIASKLEDIRRGLGAFSHYMQKEIHEQPESLRNTMRGRIQTAADQRQLAVMLGGMREHVQVGTHKNQF